ncbi:hypothetical protein ACLMJK_007337 [Lecanora helva]
MHITIVLALMTFAAAHPAQHTHHFTKRASYPNGIATFNDYAAQGNTNCGPSAASLTSAGQHGTYGAAASDISPGISGGMCSGNILMSQCAGQGPGGGYQAPGCPKSNCGKCYKVTNQGGIGGSVGGVGNSVIVQIIDACPSKSAYNFCKIDMPANQRCSDPGTNQLDIDQSAYIALTGQAWGGGANLNIGIEDSDCSGSTSTGGSGSGSGASPPASPDDLNPGLPGQHAAGGDKMAKPVAGGNSPVAGLNMPVVGGNLAIQDLGSSHSSGAPSSAIPPPPPPPTPTSAPVPAPPAPPATSPSNTPGSPAEDDIEDEPCDEL